MGRVHVDTVTGFTYPERQKNSPQLVYYDEKYS